MANNAIVEAVKLDCGEMVSDHASHDWSKAWVDPGGALWGPGPYLKLPFKWPGGEDGAERIHCPYGYPGQEAWTCEECGADHLPSGITSVGLERIDGIWSWIVMKDVRAAELEQVQAAALDAIARVMKEGEATHAVGEWREVGDVDHFNHAATHMTAYAATNLDDIEDIEHAIVRLLFIVAKIRRSEAVAKQKEGI